MRNNRNKEKQYAFDFAFDKDCSTVFIIKILHLKHYKKEVIYENTTKILIPGVLSGFNATIFAYGGTGAGKTYT